MKLPQFPSYSDCRNFIAGAWLNTYLRPGQALSYKVELDKKLEDMIYEERDFEKVVKMVWDYTNNPDYQNT